MLVRAIKTRSILPPKDDLLSAITESFSNIKLKEKSIIVITSKVVSIWQGRCLKIDNKINKDKLIKKEADLYLDRVRPNDVMLTIKDGVLIPTAGIDESNANGYYVLWPKDLFKTAKEMYGFIQKKFKLKSFGIIISDSHTTPMTTGIMGLGISFYGFYPLRDYRGKKDIFKRKIKMSQTNIVDSLAAAAVYEMGEGAEQTPIAIIEEVGDIKFGKFNFLKTNPLEIKMQDDIYYPLLKSINWKKKI